MLCAWMQVWSVSRGTSKLSESMDGRPILSTASLLYIISPQEVQALAAVEGHPNVVTYYDSWTEPAEHNQGA